MSLVNQQLLLQKIMSHAIVKGGAGPKNNNLSSINVSSPTGNQYIDIPGNVLMNDIGFFNQPNPFSDVATARFITQPLEDKVNAFPQPSYYNTVLINDANSPIMSQEQPDRKVLITLKDIMKERTALQVEPKIVTTQTFPELTKNNFNFL
jgi:hypothetical protein